ncbi:MAG: 2-oxoacid:acceptor oxidoreductase family protein, partial [Desulfofundulus sp.]
MGRTLAETSVHNIIVTGVGGQGNVLASQIIATAAVESGYFVSVGETFGASQRGGSVMS